ncbi:hypothetical protein BJV82DRAFT_675393 [Fennellomyces sp. T-0311]|nr:hypothetical protein BJV82DRAFT_675393 [Fennellomyces sp. T-0311]
MDNTRSNSNEFSELLLALLRIDRTQGERMQLINDQIAGLRESVQDQSALDRRLVNVLERNEANTTTSTAAQSCTTNTDARYIIHPREKMFNKKTNREEMSLVKFTWSLLADMIKSHREHERLPTLTDQQVDSRVEQVKKIHRGVVLYFKEKYSLTDTVKWGDRSVKFHHRAMAIKLEQEVGSIAPLSYCVGSWGAHLLLAKHWQNVEQGNNRKARKALATNSSGDNEDTSLQCDGGDHRESQSYFDAIQSSDDDDQSTESSDNEGRSSDDSDSEIGRRGSGEDDDGSSSEDDDGSSSEDDDSSSESGAEETFQPIAYEDLAPEFQEVVDQAGSDQFPKGTSKSGQEIECIAQKRKKASTASSSRPAKVLKAVENTKKSPAVASVSNSKSNRNKIKTTFRPRVPIARSCKKGR